ncbi:hypothetical protein B0F90DRAFT_1923730 [Multifurca ochricompacta]|uniref:Uncharacterized protein n=1 Tax=Multifurca ochricompacta TaxID=376703 RepID=A0AAD4QPX2_9AGAM|nr:hypothetical protein B0F90DRAFT_1923730 [Multifurca ochricompacta]
MLPLSAIKGAEHANAIKLSRVVSQFADVVTLCVIWGSSRNDVLLNLTGNFNKAGSGVRDHDAVRRYGEPTEFEGILCKISRASSTPVSNKSSGERPGYVEVNVMTLFLLPSVVFVLLVASRHNLREMESVGLYLLHPGIGDSAPLCTAKDIPDLTFSGNDPVPLDPAITEGNQFLQPGILGGLPPASGSLASIVGASAYPLASSSTAVFTRGDTPPLTQREQGVPTAKLDFRHSNIPTAFRIVGESAMYEVATVCSTARMEISFYNLCDILPLDAFST